MEAYLEAIIGGERAAWTEIAVQSVAEIEGGWETNIYALDVTYREGGATRHKDLVARFYPDDRGAARALRDAALLGKMRAAGVPVPEVELVATQPSSYGTAMVVMERIHGSVLEQDLKGSGVGLVEMARVLAAVHRLPVDAVFGDTARPFSAPSFVAPNVEAISHAVDAFGRNDFDPLLEWLSDSPPADRAPSVLHGDYHPGNIIVSKQTGDLTIIDWSFADVGDHRLDLAWAALWTGVIGGTEARSEFLAAYEMSTGEKIEDLAYFEALKLGARLLTVGLWLDSAVEPPIPKITEATIRGGYRSTVTTVYERFREVTRLRLDWVEQL
jgi:aminoglycoside phosphotransferase (APT) family kinase protein